MDKQQHITDEAHGITQESLEEHIALKQAIYELVKPEMQRLAEEYFRDEARVCKAYLRYPQASDPELGAVPFNLSAVKEQLLNSPRWHKKMNARNATRSAATFIVCGITSLEKLQAIQLKDPERFRNILYNAAAGEMLDFATYVQNDLLYDDKSSIASDLSVSSRFGLEGVAGGLVRFLDEERQLGLSKFYDRITVSQMTLAGGNPEVGNIFSITGQQPSSLNEILERCAQRAAGLDCIQLAFDMTKYADRANRKKLLKLGQWLGQYHQWANDFGDLFKDSDAGYDFLNDSLTGLTMVYHLADPLEQAWLRAITYGESLYRNPADKITEEEKALASLHRDVMQTPERVDLEYAAWVDARKEKGIPIPKLDSKILLSIARRHGIFDLFEAISNFVHYQTNEFIDKLQFLETDKAGLVNTEEIKQQLRHLVHVTRDTVVLAKARELGLSDPGRVSPIIRNWKAVETVLQSLSERERPLHKNHLHSLKIAAAVPEFYAHELGIAVPTPLQAALHHAQKHDIPFTSGNLHDWIKTGGLPLSAADFAEDGPLAQWFKDGSQTGIQNTRNLAKVLRKEFPAATADVNWLPPAARGRSLSSS